jgi:hypothetical protein
VVETEEAEEPVEGDEEEGVEWAPDAAGGAVGQWTPLPALVAVAEDEPVGRLEGLVVLVWLEIRPTEQRVE